VNGDGHPDLIVGAGAGAGGPQVEVIDGTKLTQVQASGQISGALLASFTAYAGFAGAVRVDAVDVDGDGKARIVTGAGPGSVGGHVKVFRATDLVLLDSFFAASPSFTGGVNV